MNTENSPIQAKWNYSAQEGANRSLLIKALHECPIPDNELLMNLPLFLIRQNLSHILFMQEIYQHIIDVHGVILEFGVRWGRNLALYESFRGIYEPFNHNRKIVGFDTFEGFPTIHQKDGSSDIIKQGAYSVTRNYEEYLENILNIHEQESPIGHIKKFELIKGNAIASIDRYLAANPQTIISLAYFDFDIYEPTLACLNAIKAHLTKGSVLAFDELNLADYPGETVAFKEAIGCSTYAVRHSKFSPTQSYIVIE